MRIYYFDYILAVIDISCVVGFGICMTVYLAIIITFVFWFCDCILVTDSVVIILSIIELLYLADNTVVVDDARSVWLAWRLS